MRAIRLLGLILALVLATGAVLAERGDDSDRASKNGKTEGTIDGVDVVLEYGRPNVKGREIWDGLVPYGKVVVAGVVDGGWRVDAARDDWNGNNDLSFSATGPAVRRVSTSSGDPSRVQIFL